jgi:hypothetical protein
MDLGCIVAAGHAQEIFEGVRLDAAFGVRFERPKVGRQALARADRNRGIVARAGNFSAYLRVRADGNVRGRPFRPLFYAIRAQRTYQSDL